MHADRSGPRSPSCVFVPGHRADPERGVWLVPGTLHMHRTGQHGSVMLNHTKSPSNKKSPSSQRQIEDGSGE